MADSSITSLSQLPPPPSGQKGISPSALSTLPPPPSGQQGMTLQQVQQQPDTQIAPAQDNSVGAKIARFLGGSISGQFNSGVQQVKSAVSDITSGHEGAVKGAESGLSALSGAASVISSPLAPLFAPVKSGIDAVVNGYTDKNGNHVGGISDNSAVQDFATTPAGETTARVAEDVSNAGNVAGTILGADQVATAAPKVADAVTTGAKAVADTAVKAVTTPTFVDRLVSGETPTPTDDQTSNAILKDYNTAVKPGVAGKTGTGQFDQYNNNVVSAVKAITENKNNLSLTDENGDSVNGALPTNRAQFADSVDQTKNAIFQKYNALAQAAGEKGVTVDLTPAHDALSEVINNEALKIANPGAIEYAKGIQERLTNPDGTPKTIDPETAQSVIQNYNASLKAFYKNPTYDSASKAAIDAGVVAQLRTGLDDAITNASPEAAGARSDANLPGYQALKKQYGSLSAIERDVNKSAIMQAKQANGATAGLGKYIDVFSGGDMASGLLSLNPALFAKGLAQTGISHYFQWLNSPDRAVGNMFTSAAKSVK